MKKRVLSILAFIALWAICWFMAIVTLTIFYYDTSMSNEGKAVYYITCCALGVLTGLTGRLED